MSEQTGSLYNIFYADDDIDDREVFKEIVNEINEEVLLFTQENGEELMQLLKSPPPTPHVIFLDLNMPVKNGYEVLKEIRNSERLKDYPIVVFSTANDTATIAEVKKLGASLYINKPGDYTDLYKILKHVLTIDWSTFKADGKDFVYTYHPAYDRY